MLVQLNYVFYPVKIDHVTLAVFGIWEFSYVNALKLRCMIFPS